jgi:radical SAM superfamily enzyme YgiQ (UPF0313 family)
MSLWNIDHENEKLYVYGLGKKYEIDYEDIEEIVIILKRYEKFTSINNFFSPKKVSEITDYANWLIAKKWDKEQFGKPIFIK